MAQGSEPQSHSHLGDSINQFTRDSLEQRMFSCEAAFEFLGLIQQEINVRFLWGTEAIHSVMHFLHCGFSVAANIVGLLKLAIESCEYLADLVYLHIAPVRSVALLVDSLSSLWAKSSGHL